MAPTFGQKSFGAWFIRRTGPGEVNLSYRNLITGAMFDCGTSRGYVPDQWYVEWIVNHADVFQPGDLIFTPDGGCICSSVRAAA